jgi:hypothetical protein
MRLEITHFMEDETPCVSVPLTNSELKVTMYQDDFNKLYELGLDPRWKLSRGQVVSRGRKGVSIARLVAEAGKGDKIQYLDRDPYNLRRSNLVFGKGAGTHNTRELLSPQNMQHTSLRDKVTLTHKYINPSWMNNEEEKELQ